MKNMISGLSYGALNASYQVTEPTHSPLPCPRLCLASSPGRRGVGGKKGKDHAPLLASATTPDSPQRTPLISSPKGGG